MHDSRLANLSQNCTVYSVYRYGAFKFCGNLDLQNMEIGKIRPVKFDQTLSKPSLGRIMHILIIVLQINEIFSLFFKF